MTEFGPCKLLWWKPDSEGHGGQRDPHECGEPWTHGLLWGNHFCKDCGVELAQTQQEIDDWDQAANL